MSANSKQNTEPEEAKETRRENLCFVGCLNSYRHKVDVTGSKTSGCLCNAGRYRLNDHNETFLQQMPPHVGCFISDPPVLCTIAASATVFLC